MHKCTLVAVMGAGKNPPPFTLPLFHMLWHSETLWNVRIKVSLFIREILSLELHFICLTGLWKQYSIKLQLLRRVSIMWPSMHVCILLVVWYIWRGLKVLQDLNNVWSIKNVLLWHEDYCPGFLGKPTDCFLDQFRFIILISIFNLKWPLPFYAPSNLLKLVCWINALSILHVDGIDKNLCNHSMSIMEKDIISIKNLKLFNFFMVKTPLKVQAWTSIIMFFL